MVPLFTQNADFHCTYSKNELNKIKIQRSVKDYVVDVFQNRFLCMCKWLTYLFKMQTLTVFRERVSTKSKCIKAQGRS